MMRIKNRALTTAVIAVVFSLNLTTMANHGDEDQPIRLFAIAGIAPIGVAHSSEAMAINGRLLSGEQVLWGGELIQAPDHANLLLAFDDVGQVRLRQGTVVRVSLARVAFEDCPNGRVLIATLIRGAATITLQDNAKAYIEAGGATYRSSRGASFKLAKQEGTPELEEITGKVEVGNQVTQQVRKIVALDDGGRPIAARGRIQVRLRSTRSLQFQVTDDKDKPLPDIPVIISLGSTAHGGFGTGIASVTATTNANGIASVNLVSGATQGSDSIVAEISGTNAKWEGQIEYKKSATPLWVKVAPVAAGLAGLGVWRAVSGDNNNNQPPPGFGNGGVTVKP